MTTRVDTGRYPSALIPGVVAAFFGRYVERYPAIYKKFMEMKKTNKAQETFVAETGMGLPSLKAESGSIQYTTFGEYARKRINIESWGLGFVVSKELVDDNQYKELALQSTEGLAESMELNREYQSALLLDRAFSSSYTGYDGVSLCSTAHVLGSGGTTSNRLATDQDLSQLAIQDMVTLIGLQVDEVGLPQYLMPDQLLVHTSNRHTATEILETKYQLNTMNNNVNAVEFNNYIKGGAVVSPYVTDQDAFFVTTNAKNGLIMLDKQSAAFETDYDVDRKAWKVNVWARYKADFVQYRKVVGTPGA